MVYTCAVYTVMATKWRFYVHCAPGTDVKRVLAEVCASYQENDAFCLYAATVYKSSLNKIMHQNGNSMYKSRRFGPFPPRSYRLERKTPSQKHISVYKRDGVLGKVCF